MKLNNTKIITSFKRIKLFENCERHYALYSYWWQNKALGISEKLKWELYKARKLNTLYTLAGIVVHKDIP
ncbi:hypothetical protein MWH25_02260 [Natroniella acetigena]|uniref:hypothetical protein n=1 Tax=Natroniella acetigena TaxID=52004 RepID=UPI00200A2E0F|nr:hypothetical protein [Natroniella acetigena]MCK8826573.1 hypothetical protein [Natroniella acetigena]